MSNYPVKRLRDAGVTLYDCEHKTPKPAKSGYPYIAIPNIQDGRLDLSEVRLITQEDFDYWTRKIKPQRGDIIVTRRGRVGDTAVVPEGLECAIGQNLVILRSDGTEVDQRFLRWALRGPFYEEQVNKFLNVGAIFYSLNCADIPNFELPTPPLPEQRSIAGILNALDDKIELNRRMNRTLESMARAVFRQWFVENDDSKDWETQSLEQHIEAERGLSYKGEGLSKDAGMPMHNLNSVYEGGGYKYEGIKYYTGEYKERHIVSAGDIIVTNTEQGFQYLLIGYPAIVPRHFGATGIFSHHIYRIRPLSASPLKTHYLYFLLMNPLVREQIIGCTNGTTVNMLSVDGLRTPKFKLPPRELIDKFEQFATPIFEKMELLYEESRTLASLRDTLLPKLMRGEVRVKGVEEKNG